jgi:hypothetical protein
MHFNSRNGFLLILAITAVACSRAIFAFIDDPEGPNLLVVTAMGAVIFLLSSAIYFSSVSPSLTGFKRISVTILIQSFVAAGLYFGLR